MNAVIIIGVAISMVAIAVLALTGRKKSNVKSTQFDLEFVKRKWQELEQAIRLGPSQMKQAVLEADKLLDYVLKAMRYGGEDMAHRLGAASKDLSDPDSVWEAHRLRNRLVHETGFNLIGNMAPRALTSFKQALIDLRAL